MQRIHCRYYKETAASKLSQNDLRTAFRDAVASAGYRLSESKHPILLGPPLPAGATSEDERCLLELESACDPSDLSREINNWLPDGVVISQAWVARQGSSDEQPSRLDEAVYLVTWPDAPSAEVILSAIRVFWAAGEIIYTREREQKIQRCNAKELVRNVRLTAWRDKPTRLEITVSVGPQGTLRPDEVLAVLGFPIPVDSLGIHRVALQQSAWRRLSPSYGVDVWRRRS